MRAPWRARYTGSWHRALDQVSPALGELGAAWAAGDLSVAQEHLASERLLRAVSALTLTFPLQTGGPQVLMACPDGETHDLGLRLAELVALEAGCRPLFYGANLPVGELLSVIGGKAFADAACVILKEVH